jgi:hypothetical protein
MLLVSITRKSPEVIRNLPDIYLRVNVKKVQMPDGREVWVSIFDGLLAEDREG